MLEKWDALRCTAKWMRAWLDQKKKYRNRRKDLFQACFDLYLHKICANKKTQTEEANSAVGGPRPKYIRRLDEHRHALALQEKISRTIQAKYKPPAPPIPDITPEHYALLNYYFERIPQLKKYRMPRSAYRYNAESLKKFLDFDEKLSSIYHDTKDWTLLPYSDHKGLYSFPSDYRVSFEGLNNEDSRKIELAFKKKFIAKCVAGIKDKYDKKYRQFLSFRDDFMSKNHKNEMSLEWTKLMLSVPPEVLERIMEYSKSRNKAGIDKQLFSEILPDLASLVPGCPEPPVLKYHMFDEAEMKAYLEDYVKSLNQEISSIASKRNKRK